MSDDVDVPERIYFVRRERLLEFLINNGLTTRDSDDDIEYILKDTAGEQQTLAMVKEMCKGNMEKILQPIRDFAKQYEGFDLRHGTGGIRAANAINETLALADKK
jgi:hypothetical protein